MVNVLLKTYGSFLRGYLSKTVIFDGFDRTSYDIEILGLNECRKSLCVYEKLFIMKTYQNLV